MFNASNANGGTQLEKDFFYDILTLGLITKLKSLKSIISLNVENRIPCNRLTICAWEQNNGVTLPQDLKEFYASTDGFCLTWRYQNGDRRGDEPLLIGSGEIKVNALTNLRRLRFGTHRKFDDHCLHYHNPSLQQPPSQQQQQQQQESSTDKPVQIVAFTLSHHHSVGTVCLVYSVNDCHCVNYSSTRKISGETSIWLLDMGNSWHFLAANFSTYFRMVLIHLGLSKWQFKFTEAGLTTNTKKIMTMIAPYHLYKDIPPTAASTLGSETPRNVINANIFKVGYLLAKNKLAKDKVPAGESNETKKNCGS